MSKAVVVRIVIHHKDMPRLLCKHRLNALFEKPACVVIDYDYIDVHSSISRLAAWQFTISR